MTFNPQEHIMNMRGKDYLEVKWRIVWFRDAHPNGAIITDLANTDPVLMKATVLDETGRILGTGFGTPKTQGVAAGRPFEGAETAAIGRALAIAGFGTQFTGEDEGEHIADSPVERKPDQQKSGNGDEPLLKYEDGSTVQVGAAPAAKAEQQSFTEYVKAHDGKLPQNKHNLRAWVKKVKSES
jgi:hypothetical protein